MGLYRKRPVVVDAEQWFPDHPCRGVVMYEPPPVILHSRTPNTEPQVFEQTPYPAVLTLHNEYVRVSPADWIIREPDGVHYYPCKPEVFETIYEKVE